MIFLPHTVVDHGQRLVDVRRSQWHLSFLKVEQAHRIAQGEGVTVAIIDTGVEEHPDLAGNLLPGTVVDTSATGDGHKDSVGHGTAMAGLVAAHGHGQDEGALGLAPRSKILPIVDNATGRQGDGRYTAAGVRWAIEHRADVINISSHGGHTPELEEAVEAAIDADIVVVSGVGNRPTQRVVGFPAFYPGVLAVGATDRTGDAADLSVRGDRVMITAPGVDIMTTRPNARYEAGSGTSDSTAIVSGAVALVRSRYPQLSASEVIRRITSTATDKGPPGRDDQYGYGVLNLVAALTADLPPSATPTPAAASSPPEQSPGGSWWVAVGGLVVVAVVITAFAIHVRARRHRRPRGPVA
ncbi:type VII secretion-associated serine protease mycosin [Asanoa sp. NPDC050611]|uniref:type VII secretion-associated serine protease mycosin n=1 Tax=Asanoa sp. NPDC050611 TaxID=3157098 RepID=UPI0033EDC3F0